MEIIGTNQEEKDKKSKKLMIFISITIIILFIISIILFITIQQLQKQKFKLYIDESLTKEKDNLFIYQNNEIYVSLEGIADMIGYKYYNGGYKQYSEDTDKCYLESSNEIVTFEKDSDTIYKTPTDKIDYEYFKINHPVKSVKDKLYISSDGLCLACNLKFQYIEEQNTIQIYTLKFYTDYYVTNNLRCAVKDNFKNQKALMYNLMVVQDVDNTQQYNDPRNVKYGIYTLDGKEIVGTKYTDIEFIESTQEFIVRTTENQVGIITADGETKVKPQYDSLKQIDKDLNLYLATSNNKKGVIEKNGKILIYLEYDEIGIDTTRYADSHVTNPYLLYNNIIPVKQNGKWGLYDKKGNLVTKIEYDGIGYSKNYNSDITIVIPDIKGIVLSKVYENGNKNRTTLYGIYNYLGREMVPTALENVYSVVANGREEFSMTYNGTIYNVIEYVNKWVDLEKLNDESKSANEISNNTTTTNTVTNQVNSNTVSNSLTNNLNNNVTSNVI